MFKKRNILILLIIIIPLLMIGLSNYLFASSSYHFMIDPVTGERVGRYWTGDIDGILMALAMCVFVVLLWVPACRYGYTDKLIERLTAAIINCRRYIKENRKKLLLQTGIVFLITMIAIAAGFLFTVFKPGPLLDTMRRTVFFIAAGLSVYCLIVLRGKPEKMFLALSLIIGTMYVISHPMLFFGFDIEMHYAWVVEESYVLNVSVLESDYKLANNYQHWYFGRLPSGENDAVIYSFQKGTSSLTWSDQGMRILYYRLVHIPMGIVLYFGRSLALPPNITVLLVMFFNHLFYTLVAYYAIKRINSGKYLMAVIAMLPTTLITTAAYGYEGWLVAFLLLGFSYCFNEMQNPENKVRLKSLIIMITAFLLGLAAKAVYFPVLFLLYAFRKNRFETEKGYRWYLISVTVVILFVLASFAMPFLFAVGGDAVMADERGGEGIDGREQFMFILQNPLTFAGTLLVFMGRYLNIFTDGYFISWYGSYWYYSFPVLLWLLIFFTALTDRNENDIPTSKGWLKVITAIIIFSTFAIISTAMYLGFTPVGADFIAGVQKRYLIPMLFPFFYVIFNFKYLLRFKIENTGIKVAYSMVVFGIMTLVLLNGAWNTFIP